MMKRKVLSILLIFFVLFTFSYFYFPNSEIAYAEGEEGGELSAEELRDLINQLNGDLDDLIDENDKIGAEINELANEVSKINDEVVALNKDIDELNSKIKQKEIELDNKEKEIAEQEANLNSRLKTMYKNGSIGYIDVLLGSNSISEFVYNIKMVKMIHEHDVEVIGILERQHAELEEIKQVLVASKEELDKKKADLEKAQSEYEDRIAVLKEKQLEYDSAIAAKKEEVRSAIVLLDGYVGGQFIWPLPSWSRRVGYITSWVGYRWHPVYGGWRYHGGTDIAVGTGTPIYAAGSGVVIMSRNYSNYGNTVIIDHGGGITTLYGHCSSLCCSVGDIVVAGDLIAYVGSTGAATGPHLHFEVMYDGVEQDSMQYYPDIHQYRPSDVLL